MRVLHTIFVAALFVVAIVAIPNPVSNEEEVSVIHSESTYCPPSSTLPFNPRGPIINATTITSPIINPGGPIITSPPTGPIAVLTYTKTGADGHTTVITTTLYEHPKPTVTTRTVTQTPLTP